jgi:hypothetical protein
MQELQASRNGIVECKFLSENHTVQQSQPDDPNPNTAESMVKGAHRTLIESSASLAFSVWTQFTV